uniref:Uncharacterized protein TCIL3000_11_8880 n=1 Tax=Trypanosoma congolense (strain IL3000) TaxID=1068625 RepID=G0V1B0_TRYCI|nr:unnamed protein product [Trypanosoma congolense IL3000]
MQRDAMHLYDGKDPSEWIQKGNGERKDGRSVAQATDQGDQAPRSNPGHQNANGAQANPRNPVHHNPSSTDSNTVFRCLKCIGEVGTRTKLTKHLNKSKHYSAVCVECGEQYKYFGPRQPHCHEATTSHRGFFGTFHEKVDYEVDHAMMLSRDQYRCHCLTTFLCVPHIAIHLRDDHNNKHVPNHAKCLTCEEEGTLYEMADHWLKKKNENRKALDPKGKKSRKSKKDKGRMNPSAFSAHEVPRECEIVVEGFCDSQFLVPFPQRPPRRSEGSDYVILYQCPVCLFLFDQWIDMQRHIEKTKHVNGLPQPLLERRRERGCPSVNQYLRDNLEVLADLKNPKVWELIYKYRRNNVSRDLDEHVYGFQCPVSGCLAPFLTYGEFRNHMREGRCLTMGADSTPPGQPHRPSWEEDPCAYRVTFTINQLVDVFGFIKCGECNLPFRPGEERHHKQKHHHTETIKFEKERFPRN